MNEERLYMSMMCMKKRLMKTERLHAHGVYKAEINENNKIVHAHIVYKADINENKKNLHAHGVYKA